ncbi:MAG: hypothetical protein IIB07_10885 [Bacteroidetes bacterium]|nr:hypothetical protein [Bacteroidota bacterium]MCH8941014.1 hypothetical protein [Bacteroidota bacterium]
MKSKTLYFVLLIFSVTVLFTGCSTSKENKTMSKNPFPKPTIAPGTVSVSAKILDVSENNSRTICKIHIIKVNEYGMNTQPIGESGEIEIEVPENFKSNISKNELFKIGRTIEIVLGQSKAGLGTNLPSKWSLLSIK